MIEAVRTKTKKQITQIRKQREYYNLFKAAQIMSSNARTLAKVAVSSVAATITAALGYKVGLLSGLLTIPGQPEIDYTATEAQIEADGGKHVRAKDGRIIEYFISGSERADARVLVLCHGALCTGKIMAHTDSEWLAKLNSLNIKIIAVTQPESGYSTIQPGRRIENWPRDDLQPVLAAEGVDTFAVGGVSFGSLHATAVARYFGPARVTALGLQVPMVAFPFSKEIGLCDPQKDVGYTSTSLNTSVSGNLLARVIRSMLKNPGDLMRKKPGFIERWYSALTQGRKGQKAMDDRAAFQKSDFGALFAADLDRSAHKRGLGAVYMMASDTMRSGADPREIKGIDNVVVWYAAADAICPPSHGKWLAEHFKCSERPGALRVDPGGHMTGGGPLGEFIGVLMKE